MRIRPAVLAAAFVLWMIPAPALAQGDPSTALGSPAPTETAEPVESPSPASRPGARDLMLDMPYYLGGFEPDIVVARGAEHFASLGSDDPVRADLEAFLRAVGAGVEDMDSGYALVSQEDFFAFVVAIRVSGAKPGSMLPAYLPILYGDLVDASGIAGEVGGKDVLVISSVGSNDEFVELFVYDQGDTIWMVQGPMDVVETTLDGLPAAPDVTPEAIPDDGATGRDS